MAAIPEITKITVMAVLSRIETCNKTNQPLVTIDYL